MNYYELPKTLTADIEKYAATVRQYQEQILSKDEFKVVSALMGVYEQRQEGTYMVRIKVPGGALTPRQWLDIAELTEKHTRALIHLTTRQDIQIHNLTIEEIVIIIKGLQTRGMTSRGGGGNSVRNITGSFDTGVGPDTVFDISPYLQALTTRFLDETDSYSLPRKFKINFSHSPQDTGLATISDLGFIAKKNAQGEKGFTVYLAGGMGKQSTPGFLLFDFVSESEVYNIAKATKNLFAKYGDRQNRHKARLRFVLYEQGQEKFTQLWQAEYEAVKSEHYPPLALPPATSIKQGRLTIPLFAGDLTPRQAILLGKILIRYGEDIMRLTQNQNIFIRNLDEAAVSRLQHELTSEGFNLELPPVLSEALACTGASTCRLGLCPAKNLLMAINERLSYCTTELVQLGQFKLYISGCTNSCGQHLLADIGCYGMLRQQEGEVVPYYMLVAGGFSAAGATRFAEKIGALPAKVIPNLLCDFFAFAVQTKRPEEASPDFLKRLGIQKLKELVEAYQQDSPDLKEQIKDTDFNK